MNFAHIAFQIAEPERLLWLANNVLLHSVEQQYHLVYLTLLPLANMILHSVEQHYFCVGGITPFHEYWLMNIDFDD